MRPREVNFIDITLKKVQSFDARIFRYQVCNPPDLRRVHGEDTFIQSDCPIKDVDVPIHRLCRMYGGGRDQDTFERQHEEIFIAISRDMQQNVFDPIIQPAIDRAEVAEVKLERFATHIAKMRFWQRLKFLVIGSIN